MHGAIPHHHHESLLETSFSNCEQSIPHEHSNFDNHQHKSDTDIVCDFKVLTNQISFGKLFPIASHLHYCSFYDTESLDFFTIDSPLFVCKQHSSASLRGPPALT